MAAGVHNILITKGTDFSLTMTLKDAGGAALNVTNYTFKSQIRRKQSTGTAAEFTITKTNAAGGQIKLALAKSVTAGLPNGKLLYDLVADDSSEVRQYVKGKVTVIDTVTDTSGM